MTKEETLPTTDDLAESRVYVAEMAGEGVLDKRSPVSATDIPLEEQISAGHRKFVLASDIHKALNILESERVPSTEMYVLRTNPTADKKSPENNI